MRKLITLVALVLCAGSVHAQTVAPALKAVCSSIQSVTSRGFIYKNSAPLRAGGIGTALIGYRKEPTLIMDNNVSSRTATTIYDKKGTKIGRCPWATAEHTRGGRFRCTMQTSTLRRAAMKNTKSPTVYFVLKGKSCVEVPDAGRCYGSVKGLCNRVIS